MRALLLLACIAFITPIFSTIRILTFQYNEPDFIEFQHRCLQKFMVDDYEFIVFNDAKTVENERAIQEACNKCGIRCVRFPQKWHCDHGCSSIRHTQVIQYAMDAYGYDHDDILIILDGDAFPIRKMDVRGMLKDFDVVSTGRNNFTKTSVLLWVPFVAFNPQNLPNVRDLYFHPTLIDGYMEDSGAASYYYFQENLSVRHKTILSEFTCRLSEYPSSVLKQKGYNEMEISLIHDMNGISIMAFEMGGYILHFRGTWLETKEHQMKLAIRREYLYDFLNQILQ